MADTRPKMHCPECWQAQHHSLLLTCLIFICSAETWPWQRPVRPEQEAKGTLFLDPWLWKKLLGKKKKKKDAFGTFSWRWLVFPGGSVVKESACNAEDRLQCGRHAFDPWVGKMPWRRKWPEWPGESHGQRSLAGYKSRGCKSWTWLSDWITNHHYGEGYQSRTQKTASSQKD